MAPSAEHASLMSKSPVNASNPALETLIEKDILTQMPDGKFVIRPSALADYDTYFGKVAQFNATQMSRVHKNPIMQAIKY